MENGPKAENGKKMAEKKWSTVQNGEKWSKNDENGEFGVIFNIFPPFTLCSAGGLYQIHCQSLNTHGGKHRSGGAQIFTPGLEGWGSRCEKRSEL